MRMFVQILCVVWIIDTFVKLGDAKQFKDKFLLYIAYALAIFTMLVSEIVL